MTVKKELIPSRELKNRHILDTSAVNKVLDDPESARIVERLKETEILPTTVAIAEICAEPDATHRRRLLELLKEIGGDKRPLAIPNQLAIRACRAFSRRKDLMLNDGLEEGVAWAVLNNPGIADEEAQAFAIASQNERDDDFRNLYEGARVDFDRIFRSGTDRPGSARELVEIYSRNVPFLWNVVNPIYWRAVGRILRPTQVRELFVTVPHLRLFFMAYAVAAFQRSVQERGYGHRRNPGQYDLWSAAYLPSTECFITDDTRQRRSLRLMAAQGQLTTSVISYSSLRRRLLE